ncbi:hypothetical protein STIB_20090 [Streptomyces sp. IB2014 011-1]|nr:hypothetical protein STIB_20090 [Streptomyces sp. IB2014 011-1]
MPGPDASGRACWAWGLELPTCDGRRPEQTAQGQRRRQRSGGQGDMQGPAFGSLRSAPPVGQEGGRGHGRPGWWWLRQHTTEKEIRLWDFV